MSRPASLELPSPPAIDRGPSWRHPGLLVIFCMCLWLPGFFTLPPTDRDESRFAQATKQMIETGDYVRIMNGTEPRNRKPIGIYWAQVPFAAAARATGIARANPIWPYRMPSLLGALLAVLAVALGGARLASPRQAATAGAWFASSLVLISEAHLAKTDAALVGVTTLAMLLLARAFLTPEKMTRWQAASFWIAIAAGILLKGPITPMVVVLTVITLGVWTRRWSWLAVLRPWSGILLLLLLVVPWLVAIEIATKGAFFAQSVGADLANKISGGDDAHGEPFGTYLLLIPLLAFPAALPVLRALPAAWRDRTTDETRFLLAWLVPSWLVFEIVHTKLPHYTLPLYPALFLLAARLADLPVARWWRAITLALTLTAGLLLAAALTAAPFLLHGAWWAGVPAALAILIITGLAASGRQNPALLIMPLAMVALFEIELPGLPALAISPRLNTALASHNLSGLPFAVSGYDEPSLMFLAGTNEQWFRTGNQIGDWLAHTPHGVALVENRNAAAFLKTDPRAIKIDKVDGFDYSNGKQVSIGIYR